MTTRRLIFQIALLGIVLILLTAPSLSAGDVSATLNDGTLYVKGDSSSNLVALTYYEVTWADFEEFGIVSSMEGVDGDALVNAADINAIVIELGAGDDYLSIQRYAASDLAGGFPVADISISLGAGRDFLTMGEGGYTTNVLRLAGSVDIGGGPGNDTINALTCALAGDLAIDSGPGSDDVWLGVVTAEGDARVTTGAGDDQVFVAFNPNQFLGLLAIDAGAGNDIVFYQPHIFPVSGDLTIQLGSGDDILDLSLNGVFQPSGTAAGWS